MMSEIKYCPLKFMAAWGTPTHCEEKNCAWWYYNEMGERGECAIFWIVGFLENPPERIK